MPTVTSGRHQSRRDVWPAGEQEGEGHANVTTARSTRGVRVTTSYSSFTPQSICLMPFTQAVISQGVGETRAGGVA